MGIKEKKEHILILEDDEGFRKTLTKVLEKEGYSVTGASDAAQAITQAKKAFFELIVADVRLPKGIDGIEVVKAIRALRPQARNKVIIITGYANENVPIRAIRLGVDDYIYKPFKSEELLHSIERNLKIYRLEKEKERHLEMLEKMNNRLKAAKNQLKQYNLRLAEKIREKIRELNTTQSQLVQAAKMSTIGQIGAGVAHELNNPLVGILGYAQFLLQKMGEAHFSEEEFKSCKHNVEYIEKEAKRCKEIVEKLLYFSRKPMMEQEPQDISQLMENTLGLVRNQIQLQDIKIITNYEPKLPTTLISGNQLQQVFLNIIINARQAMPNGGTLEIDVRTSEEKRKKYLKINFKDTGCGIAKQNLEKVFEPFFTNKQDWKSLGLGLAICYQIIKDYQGTISVESEEGKGARFTITLPVVA